VFLPSLSFVDRFFKTGAKALPLSIN
jgi:hypothetical protein